MSPAPMLRFSAEQLPAALTMFRQALDKVETAAFNAKRNRVMPMARDQVSGDVAAVTSYKVTSGDGSVFGAMDGYLDQLKSIVEQLENAARQYNISDQASAGQFKGGSVA
ncbi:hypothetical protein D5S17_17690 [Pseudonocardiaceae bacterium YIM PH 21723]|nr:hypothetical protein D5S17_17690 [Pseudonocardiaceae bacterium YIM PH 21723]